MSGVFLTLLNMSITASWLILAVLLIRPMLKKAPKWIPCTLWALVAIRLLCPFSIESRLSLVPVSQIIPQDIVLSTNPQIDTGIVIINDAINPVIASQFTPDQSSSANPLQVVIPVLSVVWFIGMVLLLGYALFSYIRLKRSVDASIAITDKVMACDEVRSPFILGILHPVIYVPSALKGTVLSQVITHEMAHLKRHDHWWKPLGYLLLSVYWFDPLCWLAYGLLCRDIELACDEKVIRDLDSDSKAAYSQALLDCSYPRKWITACPLAFGEIGVKERVKSILNYKKPAFWIVFLSIFVCIVVAVCLLTNPVSNDNTVTETANPYTVYHMVDRWDCSVLCTEESTPEHYVVNYSDKRVLSHTGILSFQNRNAFDIVIHILPENGAEIVSEPIPAGGCFSQRQMADKTCVIGVHADVDKNAEIKLMVYDGDSTEPYTMTEYPAAIPAITAGTNADETILATDIYFLQPLPGNFDHAEAGPNLSETIFLTGSDQTKVEAYIERLKDLGYAEVIAINESDIMNWVLTAEYASQTIVYKSNSAETSITVCPIQCQS